MSRVVRVLLTWIFLAGAANLSAGVHPVPLEPNTDSKTCAECHEDKAKGKFVHSAVAMGCTSCHEVRSIKGVTRIKLITSTPQALCITCHADMNAATIHGTVHPPAVRDCIKCHSPHQSDNKYQLLKPTSGDKGQNLCLECHTQGLERSRQGQPPRSARHGMRHLPCSAQDRRARQAGVRLSPDQSDSGVVPRLPRSYFRRSAEGAQGPALRDCQLRAVSQSAPVATSPPDAELHPCAFRSGACDTCHQPAKDGKVVLTQTEPKAHLCHLSQRAGREDREGQGATSGSAGRLHHLP